MIRLNCIVVWWPPLTTRWLVKVSSSRFLILSSVHLKDLHKLHCISLYHLVISAACPGLLPFHTSCYSSISACKHTGTYLACSTRDEKSEWRANRRFCWSHSRVALMSGTGGRSDTSSGGEIQLQQLLSRRDTIRPAAAHTQHTVDWQFSVYVNYT